MFMSQVDNDDIETLFGKSKGKNMLKKLRKKPSKIAKKPAVNLKDKSVKTVKKAKPKKVAKVAKAKVLKTKAKPVTPVKKALKSKKAKPKVYKVSGSFTIDSEGNVLKQTKSIYAVSVGDKSCLVTFADIKR